MSSLLKDLNWAPLNDRRRDIRLAMLFKIVKCNMPVQADTVLLLIQEPEVITVANSNTYSLILLSINIRFLSEQYLSGTLCLKPTSTRIPSPHSRRSSVRHPERCALPPIVVIHASGLAIILLELELVARLCSKV